MVARRIEVVRTGRTTRVVVDGVEIPADAILRDSLTVPVNPDDRPTIVLALTADRVEVINTLEESEPPPWPS
ncbi:hypothetical protein ABZ605_08335 [Streptomyces sp. NPDC012765]|uniref:hypothetical protein n=1 Tax=Streptomyces sp. NPDC012765 TaxID=3155249 RepID=UPI0033E29C8F